MDNRDTLLSARFPADTQDQPFLELDLREFSAVALLARRSQLQVTTKLVFKAGADHRQDQSVFRIWADLRVTGQDGASPTDLGRAVIPDPVFFEPGQNVGPARDLWTRTVDRLTLDLDDRQLDAIEQKRAGGALTFVFAIGGLVYHSGRIAALHPSNHQLTYDVSASTGCSSSRRSAMALT